jgi:hypothetical protein
LLHQIDFGLAEQASGSMPGPDIVIASVNDEGSTVISDRYASQKATPAEDDCSHWTVLSGTETGGTTVELVRNLDTNDKQRSPNSHWTYEGSYLLNPKKP